MSSDRATAPFLLITCEHAGRVVPREYRHLFRGATAVLRSHRGWDIGARGVAERMAERLAAPLMFVSVSRLLVEANRSPDHPELFSEYTRHLPPEDRAALVARYHRPHRRSVEALLSMANAAGRRAVHVGVHSFTDEGDAGPRAVDIGLLFDPARAAESALCAAWRDAVLARRHDLRVHFNEPYLGVDDGLTTTLRRGLADGAYAGIELEVRQGLIGKAAGQRALGNLVADALREALDGAL